MAEAEILTVFAGPLVTFQDAGRPSNMRYGVAASGPMDRLAFDAAHAALGNPAGQTVIEISLAGMILQCKAGEITVAVTGGDFVVDHDGNKTSSWTILTLKKGERLAIRAGVAGSWAYLAFAGTLNCPSWLGSQATHSTSGFGGGAIQAGQVLKIDDAVIREDRLGEISRPDFVQHGSFRVVAGPQDHHFADDAVAQLCAATFRVTDAYDRMGMRLDGCKLTLREVLSIPSEPIVRGAIQVSGDGIPTVLLADHQTTGGYPKIATIISCDTDRIAQHRAGQDLRFSVISCQQAIAQARAFQTAKKQYLDRISVARGTLAQRLMRENLIQAFIDE